MLKEGGEVVTKQILFCQVWKQEKVSKKRAQLLLMYKTTAIYSDYKGIVLVDITSEALDIYIKTGMEKVVGKKVGSYQCGGISEGYFTRSSGYRLAPIPNIKIPMNMGTTLFISSHNASELR